MVIERFQAALLCGCILLSCGRGVCVFGGDAGEDRDGRVDDGGVEDPRAEDMRDMDALDGADRADIAAENTADLESPDGCRVPILDCGPGCRQVTCMGTIIMQYSYDLYENYLAYFSRDELFLKDLESGEEKMLYQYSYHVYVDYLAMYGDRIVFTKWPVREGGTYGPIQLMMYDTASSTLEEIYNTCGGPILPDGNPCVVNTLLYLDMYGDKLVTVTGDRSWGEDLYEVFMFDFNLRDMIQISETPYHSGAFLPRIWGDTVVFSYMGSPFRIMVIDLETGSTRPLTDDVPADQWHADIWGGRVVWTDHRNGPGGYYGTHNTDIYWCDLPDCEPRPATTDPMTQDWPSVEGDWIVWVDFRNDPYPLDPELPIHENLEIWGYHVPTDTEVQVASFNPDLLFAPIVYNGRVYFQGSPTGNVNDGTTAIFEVVLPEF
jgi:hypothetical protein